jgi:hypothetical protein
LLCFQVLLWSMLLRAGRPAHTNLASASVVAMRQCRTLRNFIKTTCEGCMSVLPQHGAEIDLLLALDVDTLARERAAQRDAGERSCLSARKGMQPTTRALTMAHEWLKPCDPSRQQSNCRPL